jgi:hypothetical protein
MIRLATRKGPRLKESPLRSQRQLPKLAVVAKAKLPTAQEMPSARWLLERSLKLWVRGMTA